MPHSEMQSEGEAREEIMQTTDAEYHAVIKEYVGQIEQLEAENARLRERSQAEREILAKSITRDVLRVLAQGGDNLAIYEAVRSSLWDRAALEDQP